MNEYPTTHLKYTMDSEWDILQALHWLMNQMNDWPKLEWVASHQDDDPTIDTTALSTETQIKLQTDMIISKGLQRLHTKPKLWSVGRSNNTSMKKNHYKRYQKIHTGKPPTPNHINSY